MKNNENTAYISISEAIRLSGRARSWFYANHLSDKAKNSDRISTVDHPETGKKCVMVSELRRFYPDIQYVQGVGLVNTKNAKNSSIDTSKEHSRTDQKEQENKGLDTELEVAKVKIAFLEQQLEEARKDKDFLQSQLAATTRLIEDKRNEKPKKGWWPFRKRSGD